MTSVQPINDSSSDESVQSAQQPSPPAYVVQPDKFVPQGLIPGASLNKLLNVKTLKMRLNKTMYNATANVDVPNRFMFLDENGQQLFIGHESSELVCRCAMGRTRSYTMAILSENNDILMEIVKEYSCLSTFGCCAFWQDKNYGHSATVLDSQREPQGSVVQMFDMAFPRFRIQDTQNEVSYDIISRNVGCWLPFMCSSTKGNLFTIYLKDSPYEIGQIGVEKSSANSSYVTFPEDSGLMERTLLLAALVHINILFFTNYCG